MFRFKHVVLTRGSQKVLTCDDTNCGYWLGYENCVIKACLLIGMNRKMISCQFLRKDPSNLAELAEFMKNECTYPRDNTCV